MTRLPAPPCPRDWMRRSPIDGLAAIVVGGGSGIGEATARTLAANGCSVTVADLNPEAAQRVAAGIGAAGGRASAIAMNVALQPDVEAAVAAAVAAWGRLDIVVNCAARVAPELLEQVSEDSWRSSFDINVLGTLLLGRTCLPHLRLSPAAAIVNVSSLGALWGRPGSAAYAPSKAAVTTLTKQMALEWAQDGVRVNAVVPGTILTPLALATVPAEVLEQRAQTLPLKRLGSPDEMADLIVFLASPAASYITAQAFECDGGQSQSMFATPMKLNG